MELGAIERERHYRVPQQSGSALIDPGLEQLRTNLETRRATSDWNGVEFCGHSVTDLRLAARAESIQLSHSYTRQYADVPAIDGLSDGPLLLTGHQPELFHAGVWFKNFLVSQLALQTAGVAINFLVDNDLCRTTAIRVPCRLSGNQPSVEVPLGNAAAEEKLIASAVAFDAARDSIPWEHRRVNDVEQWRSFPRQVRRLLVEEIRQPLVHRLWDYAVEAIAKDSRVGYAIAQARHRIELQHGLRTLEVPLSHLVSTLTFARFSLQLLGELPRLQAIYNGQRAAYRRLHHIRSQAHPVPLLEQQHGWLEAPWWVYRPEAPHRQRLWVRLVDDALILSDQAGWQATIEGRLDCDNASAQWLDLLADGICLRPRALLTTMYLRMLVGDTFIHGIGGGKYDQLTDAIMREFFGITPPDFVVASATMHLPLKSSEENLSSQAEQQRLWELKFHSDQLPSLQIVAPEFGDLVRRKRELLENIPPRGEKWKWHLEMTRLNAQLANLANDATQATQRRLEQAQLAARQRRISQSREYSFCLFEAEQLIPQLQRAAAGT